jgi:hypothetical protein
MAPSFSGGFDCAIAVVAAITSTDASNPDAIFFIATSHKHAASFLRDVFIVDGNHAATHTQRQAQPMLGQQASRNFFR